VSTPATTLFNLLPALYRLRDAQLAQSGNLNRGPLESILAVVEEQMAILGENLDQLYDDQFIETCAPWVIPYIGELIGYQPVNGIAPAVASPRAEVAHTISFRRRKGTALVMEQLARDVTGWGAHAVEFFLRLADTQYMNHIRPDNYYAPNLREWEPGEYMNGGFDETAHTVDVRRIAISRGRYNIQNIGIFLWSCNSYSVTHTPLTAVAGQPQCFRFSSLGSDIALFNLPVSQGPDITDPATPLNVPDRLRRRVLCRDIWQITVKLLPAQYYGTGPGGENLSLALYQGGALIDPKNVRICNLSGDDGSWNNLPAAGGMISIDPQLGRLAVPPGNAGNITATYYYGFNADLGGGEYSRAKSLTAPGAQAVAKVPADYATVHEAIAALGGDGVVEITDSGIYAEPAGLNIAVKAKGHISLVATDGNRPTLLLGQALSATGGDASLLDINGLVIGYAKPVAGGALPAALIDVPATAGNTLGGLGIAHATVVPGWALNPDGTPQAAYAGLPVVRAQIAGLNITVDNSILGSLWVNGQSSATLTNCVIDATDPGGVAYVDNIDTATQIPHPGGALTLQGCTVVGKVHASLLNLVTDSIVWAWLSAADQAAVPPLWRAPLWADRKQEGCIRFSYLPANAIVPRRFECVEMAPGVPQPLFYSLRYGDPVYAKLRPSTADLIRRGADDGGEMGVFHFLFAPLRESDLRIRLREYLPAGLEFGIFYQN
jgi:hypothetical protein